jgi:hypothetical protein
MDAILSALFGITTNSIPSAVIMVSGIILLLISGGLWGISLDDKTKNNLKNLGFVLLIFGASLTAVVSMFQIWSSYSPLILSVLGNVFLFITKIIFYSTNPLNWLVIGMAGIVIMSLHLLRLDQIKKGYKIKFGAVENFRNLSYNDHYTKEANIQVVNIGERDVCCSARIAKIFFKDGEISINEFNPDGECLSWLESKNEFMKLQEGIPQVLKLLVIDFSAHNSGDRGPYFVFNKSKKSKPLTDGKYKIQVVFSRWDKEKRIEFPMPFEKTLIISDGDFHWSKDG